MKEIKLLKQPYNSQVCGQTSLAMILGITAEQSIQLFGHNKSTTSIMVKNVLDRLGVRYGELYVVNNRKKNLELPDYCMVRLVKSGNRTGHAVAHIKGKFYDPMGHIFDDKDDMLVYYKASNPRWKIHTYYEIFQSDFKGLGETDTTEERMVAGTESELYMVTLSHQMFGKIEYIKREMTLEDADKLKNSDKFTIVSKIKAKYCK